jgi:hypothetical protein
LSVDDADRRFGAGVINAFEEMVGFVTVVFIANLQMTRSLVLAGEKMKGWKRSACGDEKHEYRSGSGNHMAKTRYRDARIGEGNSAVVGEHIERKHRL